LARLPSVKVVDLLFKVGLDEKKPVLRFTVSSAPSKSSLSGTSSNWGVEPKGRGVKEEEEES
jgi:hypothetical protein